MKRGTARHVRSLRSPPFVRMMGQINFPSLFPLSCVRDEALTDERAPFPPFYIQLLNRRFKMEAQEDLYVCDIVGNENRNNSESQSSNIGLKSVFRHLKVKPRINLTFSLN